MLFANIEMFIAINKFVSDLFIATNKFYKFMVFVRRNDLWQGQNGCNTIFVRRKWAFTGQSDV